MLALETVPGVRIVGDPDLLDREVPGRHATVLRLAPDELLILGPATEVAETYPDLIVAAESGFVGCWLTPDELAARVLPHVDWALPVARPFLAQGLVAGVPAKLWLESGRALLLCAAPYAFELAERLG